MLIMPAAHIHIETAVSAVEIIRQVSLKNLRTELNALGFVSVFNGGVC